MAPAPELQPNESRHYRRRPDEFDLNLDADAFERRLKVRQPGNSRPWSTWL